MNNFSSRCVSVSTPLLYFRVEQRSLATSQETRWGLEKHEGEGGRIWKRQHSVAHSLVTATLRLFFPSSMASKTSSGLHTKRSVQPCGDTDSHKEAQGFVATRRQVGYTERRLFTAEAIRYCNRLMQIWNDYRIHSNALFNTSWKHIVRRKRLIPLDTRILKLDIDQASSFFIYMDRQGTVQSTDAILFLALMSFIANSWQFVGIDLWLWDGIKQDYCGTQNISWRTGERRRASHLHIGNPVFVLVHRQVGFCHYMETGS